MQPTDKSLLIKLIEYNESCVPLHMPGHKRNTSLLSDKLPYDIDITEVDGFDNLHDMQGVLKDTALRASKLYGTKFSFPLIGGTTCGILAAIHALAPAGSDILMARESHKSVYHAVDLLCLTPHYISAEKDPFGIGLKITPAAVETALKTHKNISLVVLTSPTYEGVISDISSIAAICHAHNALLLVDAAHGAHLGLSPYFLGSAKDSGADIVVMSLHKTMPSLTQTALLHICSDRVDALKLADSLSIFESSSPSYVLLSSIDECLRFTSENKDRLFTQLHKNLTEFYDKAKSLKNLSVLHYDDLSKIIISTQNTTLNGVALADRLRCDYKIETEMACSDYVLAMTSICDKKESFDALFTALHEIDAALEKKELDTSSCSDMPRLPKQRSIPHAARKKSGAFFSLKNCKGLEALEYVWAYPPGIPLLVPGEIINEDFLKKIEVLKKANVAVLSTKGKISENKLYVAK